MVDNSDVDWPIAVTSLFLNCNFECSHDFSQHALNTPLFKSPTYSQQIGLLCSFIGQNDI